MSYSRGETPSLHTALGVAFDRRERQMQTAFPAKVTAFDSTTQTVDVEPAFHETWREGDTRRSEPPPVIPDVPICYPRGNGFSLYIPPAPGDWMLVVCSKYSLDKWRRSKTSGDPGDLGRFTFEGAIAIPGIFPDEPVPTGPNNANTAVLAIPGGKQLWLGNAATSFIALATKVNAELSKIKSALENHQHSYVTPIPATPPSVTVTTLNTASYARADVDSDKVKSE